ncbi:RNA polymerase II-associated protein 3 isoform X2 [Pseudomyrmex gracilis]|uniref:RNA polymerase II-associated protein 3 isoform X2 n=1 Tax=Pseudomyrmex gracilis TaxID=219809 RepID=UPI000995C812|nr:RNA polymerase II-associated protein 3 isoform X2 [Pseudomyrmex gracilis]
MGENWSKSFSFCGIYPDLTKHAEKRLAEIKPTSAVLHTVEPVLKRNMLDTDERQEIDEDIGNWTRDMRSREKDLDEGKATLISDPSSQPEIRKPNLVKKDKKTTVNEKKRDKPKRIASCDYAAWDKYDVDTEINRIDLRNEQRQTEIKRIQELRKEQDERNKTTARKTTVDKLSLTGTEVNVMAEREREKGNEAFRAADYEEALRHYDASIEMDSNLNARNNRAMTFIKLRRYEDALNDCNTVISRDYKNVKALLRRAVSLEHLERTHEALADYEAVLILEPTNKTAISGANRLRKPCERKIRMKIAEENIIDGEDKAEQIKSETTAETNNAACSRQRVNSNICYCDRAPGSSRSIATKPHLKASYCVEAESNKATAAADAVANKSKKRPTRDSSSGGNKLSPVAKDFGDGYKTTKRDAGSGDDVFATSRESLPKSRGAQGASLEKSIFSCVFAPRKAKSSTVVIEELPPCDDHQPTTDNNVRATNKSEKPKKLDDSRAEARPEIKRETTMKSNVDIKNEKSISSDKKANLRAKKKLDPIKDCQRKNKTLETDIQNLQSIESPYEFLRLWQSLKDDTDLKLHAKLLRCVAHGDMNTIIGNKLDGTMFSLILRCLEQQFCTSKDRELLMDLLLSLSRVSRFSIVRMFMDSADKKAVENILRFLNQSSIRTPYLSYLKKSFAV